MSWVQGIATVFLANVLVLVRQLRRQGRPPRRLPPPAAASSSNPHLCLCLCACARQVPMGMIGHAGVKYGVPFPVLARSSFGVRGAVLPAVLRGAVAAGW